MNRRHLRPVLWLSIACALLLSTLGCGQKPAAAGSYTSAQYGFSLTYQSPLEVLPSPAPSSALGTSFAYGLIDSTAGGLQDGTYAGVLVSVTEIASDQPAAVVQRAAWWTQEARSAARLGDFKLLSKKEFTLNGVPARLFEGEGTNAGKPFHFKNVAIFTGNRLYELVTQWPTATSATTGKAISNVIDSFTLSDDLKASAVASEKLANSASVTARRYVNKRYRFQLWLPAGFLKLSADVTPNLNGAAFAVGFADTAPSSNASAASGELLTVFGVQVGVLPKTLSKSQAAVLLHAMSQSSSAHSSFEKSYAAKYTDMKMGNFTVTRIGVLPALAVDVTYVSSQGTAQRQRVYLLISGKYMYQLQLEASQSVWNDRIGVLQKIARSFRTP